MSSCSKSNPPRPPAHSQPHRTPALSSDFNTLPSASVSPQATMEKVGWKLSKICPPRKGFASLILTKSIAMRGSRASINCSRSSRATCPRRGWWPVSARAWPWEGCWWPCGAWGWPESSCFWAGKCRETVHLQVTTSGTWQLQRVSFALEA